MKGVLLSAAAGLALACASQEPTREERLARGHELYLTYCVACHGADGNGGPVAPYLSPAPRDLRAIAARNGGSFPRMLVEGWIDGREPVGAHGTREMPVWGASFGEELAGDDDREHHVRERFSRLVEYLESVQAR
jgi:mono/diheme cytochrome c family protein